jgi:putative endonuclease
LFEHNSGLYVNSFTTRGISWELSLSYTCESSEKAYKLEAFIKRMKSKKFIERLIEDKMIINDIATKL